MQKKFATKIENYLDHYASHKKKCVEKRTKESTLCYLFLLDEDVEI